MKNHPFYKNVITAFLAVIISSFAFGQKEKPVVLPVLGPYLQNMLDDQVTICWATPEGITSYGQDGERIKIVPQYRHHSTIITGLKPGATYTYDVLNDGTDNGKGTFTTFPKNIEPFKFCVLGDTRSRHDVHQKIVNRIIDEKPLFVVNTGDLVGNGNNMEDWQNFFRVNDKLTRNVPYYTVLGNHEKDSENYYDFFSLPGNESYYFFSVGDALFVVLDMEGPHYDPPAFLKGAARDAFWENISIEYMKQEKEWFENLLTLNEDAGYIFVFFHAPLYSVKKSRVAESKMRRAFWGDIFEKHRVSAVLNGHDHYYSHAIDGGVHHIITAGGGAPLYDGDALQPETVKYKKIEHYMRMEVGTEETKMTAIDINGEIIEEIVVKNRRNK